MNDKNGIARTLGDIGLFYTDQSDHEKSLEYMLRALKIQEEFGR
ncbi:MAG: tetratricopeptide repeat protein [Bacteroidetes bacterium]|jgi:hypothetical protein|nr:tetratricopeptide repeat protein [Bacteroidota bacterium]MDF1866698.1 hypothetical protein [Saprospiraceae bacterium]